MLLMLFVVELRGGVVIADYANWLYDGGEEIKRRSKRV